MSPALHPTYARSPCQTPDVSYELVFWQQDASQSMDPDLIYQELVNERGSVPGLNDIPWMPSWTPWWLPFRSFAGGQRSR